MTLAVMAERNVSFFMGFVLVLVFCCELAAIQSDESPPRPFKSSQYIFTAAAQKIPAVNNLRSSHALGLSISGYFFHPIQSLNTSI